MCCNLSTNKMPVSESFTLIEPRIERLMMESCHELAARPTGKQPIVLNLCNNKIFSHPWWHLAWITGVTPLVQCESLLRRSMHMLPSKPAHASKDLKGKPMNTQEYRLQTRKIILNVYPELPRKEQVAHEWVITITALLHVLCDWDPRDKIPRTVPKKTR